MKKITKIFSLLVLTAALFGGCENEDSLGDMAKLTDDIYYVVGSHAQMMHFYEDGTAKSGVYLFISKNLRDTVCVFNGWRQEGDWKLPDKLFDDIFEFPEEIITTNLCGYTFFKEGYRYSYPVKIDSYRPITKDEYESISIYCMASYAFSPISPNKYIVVESLSKIE